MKKFAVLTAILLAMVTMIQFTSVAKSNTTSSKGATVVTLSGPAVIGGGW